MSIYTIVWLFLHVAARNPEFGVRWLIYLTDLAYLILTIAMLLMAILNVWYLILYYGFPSKIEHYIPSYVTPKAKIYSQDNTPWFVKVCWLVYVLGTSLAPLIMLGYYIIVFPNAGSSMGMGNSTTNGSGSQDPIDVHTIQFHGINFLLVLLDLFFTRIPFQFLHFFYSTVCFMIPWAIFSIIYWAAAGTNPDNEMRYIYSPLDYSKASGYGWAIALIVVSFPAQMVLFLLAWLRDVIYTRIRCCYRDINRRPFREELPTTAIDKAKEATAGTVL